MRLLPTQLVRVTNVQFP